MSIIENINNTNKVHNNSTSSVSISNTQSNVSSSALPMVDSKKQELIKKLRITLEHYETLKAQYPNFDTLSIDKQIELVNTLRSANTTELKNIDAHEEVSKFKTEKQLFNEKSSDAKIEDCYKAFTRNTYIYGIKDKNGNVIAKAHSEEDWNKLSDADKQAEIEKVKAFIDKDKRLSSLKETFLSAAEKHDSLKSKAADSVMRNILASDYNGMSFVDFLQKDEYERLGIVEEFLTVEEAANKDNLNASDKAYMKYSAALKSQIGKIVSERTGKDVGDNLDASDVAKYMRYYNLDKTELMYNAISEKAAEQRTEADLKFLSNFKSLDNVRSKAKAQNFISLKDELSSYEGKLKNGEQLTSEEQANYNLIKKYMATDEAKQLEEVANHLPKPETDYEKSVNNDVEDFQAQIKDFVHGSDIETNAVLTYIDVKCKGMSEAQKKEYVKNFLKFYNSEASVNAFGIYSSKYKDMWADKDLTDKAVLNIGNADTQSSKNVADNIEKLRISKDTYNQKQADGLIITANKTLAEPKCNGSEHDDKKLIFVNQSAKHENAEVQISSYDTLGTIEDADKQVQAVETLQKSPNATDELQVHAANNADKLKGKAQITSLDIATQKSEKATAAAAENGVVAKLDKENQTKAFSMVRNRIEQQFNEEDAIKYSNSLADQIKDCHKDNQLAMHKDIMQSKYSEVQEHAAANIEDYDPSVQSQALDAVYESGNERAIDAAVNSLESAPSCVQEEVLPKIVGEAAARNNLIELAQSPDTVSLQERLASGAHLSQSEFNALPSDVKREYFANYFKKLPLEQKIKLLSSIPNGAQKKTIYVMIARTDANLFNAIVKDKDRADMLLSMGLPNDVKNKITNVVKFLAVSDIGYQNIAKKYDIEYENEKNKQDNSLYTTNPYGFDIKEIYLKDKKGNLMV